MKHQVIKKLVCYCCGINCDLRLCNIYIGEIKFTDYLCLECIKKEEGH